MKKKFLFLGLLLVSLVSCVQIDRIEYRPEYFVANHSNADVYLIYTLQQSAAAQGVKQTDTIAISASDTILLDFKESWEKLDLDKECKPAGLFKTLKFATKSGEVLQEIERVNNKDWTVCHGVGNFTLGWLYEFKKE